MENLKTYLAPLGRLLMSSLFVWAGVHNLSNMSGTAQYFEEMHMPAPEVAAWVVMIIHLVGGAAVLVGFMTRWAAAALAIFCLLTGFAVHLPAGEMIQFYKNLGLAGGFLYIVAFGSGGISVDRATGIEKG